MAGKTHLEESVGATVGYNGTRKKRESRTSLLALGKIQDGDSARVSVSVNRGHGRQGTTEEG